MKKINFLLIIILLTSSCVSNKKLLYMQTTDELKTVFPTDSTIRVYELNPIDYKLQPNDALYLEVRSLTPDTYDFFSTEFPTVQNVSNLQSGVGALIGYLIDNEGYIQLPVEGHVKVSGYTIFEVEPMITEIIKNYLNSPTVKVRLFNYRYTVLGEVNQESTVATYENRITILEAIGRAGGMTDMADRSRIKVIRNMDGKAEVYYLNILDESMINSSKYYIEPNDVIIVPPLKQRPFQKYFAQNTAVLIALLNVALLTITLVSINR